MRAAANHRSAVYGSDEVDLYDVAELYHEASKLYPALVERQTAGIVRLLASEDLQKASSRPARRNPQLPATPLPEPEPPTTSLWSALESRRSSREFDGPPLRLTTLATVLQAAYGVMPRGARAVPSGGALYPLELYVVACRVEGLPPSLVRFDPEAQLLETFREGDLTAELDAASALPGLLDDAAAVLLVSAVFWRSRFKYGLRGYRFALLEAGHVVQNVSLAAAALQLAALPLGGFYDDRLDELVGLDGVDESIVYGMVLGGERR